MTPKLDCPEAIALSKSFNAIIGDHDNAQTMLNLIQKHIAECPRCQRLADEMDEEAEAQ